jgi:hypothetical protein
MMDFGRAFTFVLEDRDWVRKLLLVGLITLIPFAGWIFVLGWTLEISGRVTQGEAVILPGLEDFGERMVQGVKGFVIAFIYTLPITVVAMVYGGIFALNTDAAEAAVISTVLYVCCISAISLILAAFMPAAFGALADTGQIREAFRLGRILALIKAAPGAYLLAIVGVWLAGFLSMLGLLLFCVGIIFTAVYAAAVQGNLYGQAYREGLKGIEAL